MKKIILNCVPPFGTNIPSPPLSILKSWLTKYGINSSIIYWNLLLSKLQHDFVWNNPKIMDTSNNLALYINYIIFKSKKSVLQESFKQVLQGYSPQYCNDNYYYNHMQKFAERMDEAIDIKLSKINIYDTLLWGFSIKMDGWIAASIIADKIKKIAPEIPIVIGGINTKKNAQVFLDNFSQFDIAVWGEGEEPLIQLAKTIESGEKDYSNTNNIAYRDKGSISFSQKRNKYFSDMSEDNIYPNYDDYFLQRKELKMNDQCIIPIEGSRGCHWNRCKFCYLNEDYKYRLKSIDKICTEIRYMIEKYKIYCFEFLDNDFIGLDLGRADQLMDRLVQIKKEEPKFEIVTIEVITKGLDYAKIKKMYNAGVTFVQIGYESTSNNLLRKINKKNTFASNLFYVKIAHLHNVPLFYVNLIISMPDETIEDIIESTNNLKFLRFFLHQVNFRHVLTPVQVNTISRYYPKIKNETDLWIPSLLAYEFLKEKLNKESHWDIFSFIKQSKHYQWNAFISMEKYYLENKYSYSLDKDDTMYKYSEYINGRKNIEIDIEKNSITWQILYYTDDRVISLENLCIAISNDNIGEHKLDNKEIIKVVDELTKKGLIYHSPDYAEIVSVINCKIKT